MNPVKDKKTFLYIVLSGIFLTNALLAELVGVKIFSLEGTLGIDPAQINIFGSFLDFNLTTGVLLWPVVFITTDIINEYFGKEGVKKITFLTIAFIVYAFLIITVAIYLAPAQFWVDININSSVEQPIDINLAFQKIFGQGANIIVGSLIAFLIGQLLDVFVFHKLRKLTGSKKLWLRATGSTLVSQLVDSFVVLFIAFYFLAPKGTQWPAITVVSVALLNYIYKFIIAVVLTPVLYLGHNLIDNYLGKEKAQALMEEAADKSEGFF